MRNQKTSFGMHKFDTPLAICLFSLVFLFFATVGADPIVRISSDGLQITRVDTILPGG